MNFADKLIAFLWPKPANDLPERTRRRVVVYLIPYLFFLYILAYLDRVNVSVAKFGMEKSIVEGGLGFTTVIIGFGTGLFFWGYWILEIPSTLSVLRWGARWVFVRILVLWGLCCTLIGLVGTPVGDSMFGWLDSPAGDAIFAGLAGIARFLGMDPGPVDNLLVRQFYFLRFMLGFFEGGFFPSVILYLTLWFPARDRAKAIATFMSAIPISSVFGNPLSGLLLHLDWAGLEGWRWIFILQGGVPILAGFATLFFLPDRPRSADWLPEEEKTWLVGELEREQAARRAIGHWEWVPQIGTVLLLTGYYFCMNVTSYGLTTFMPSIIKSQAKELSDTMASIVAALPYVLALFGMLYNGRHSDRTQERILHVAVPLVCLSAGIFLAGLTSNLAVVPVLCMIFLVGPFMYAHLPAFWPLPSTFLGAAAAASAIGFINMLGNLGGSLGPSLVGEKAASSYQAALFTLAPFPLYSAAIILFVGYTRRNSLAAARK